MIFQNLEFFDSDLVVALFTNAINCLNINIFCRVQLLWTCHLIVFQNFYALGHWQHCYYCFTYKLRGFLQKLCYLWNHFTKAFFQEKVCWILQKLTLLKLVIENFFHEIVDKWLDILSVIFFQSEFNRLDEEHAWLNAQYLILWFVKFL